MKPLQVGLLIAAGALGGAVVMKVVQKPQDASPDVPAVVVQSQPAPPVAPAPPPIAPAAPAAVAAVELEPSPVRASVAAPKRQATRPVPLRTYQRKINPEGAVVAQNTPAPVSTA